MFDEGMLEACWKHAGTMLELSKTLDVGVSEGKTLDAGVSEGKTLDVTVSKGETIENFQSSWHGMFHWAVLVAGWHGDNSAWFSRS